MPKMNSLNSEASILPRRMSVAFRRKASSRARVIFSCFIFWRSPRGKLVECGGIWKKQFSGKSPLAGAIRYALTRLPRLRPYLEHGHLEIDNNAAERAIRGIALGRKNYLFVGSPAGGKAAAIAYTLIETAKLNDVDPQGWLADTLARIPDCKITKVDDLLPWNMGSHHHMKDAA